MHRGSWKIRFSMVSVLVASCSSVDVQDRSIEVPNPIANELKSRYQIVGLNLLSTWPEACVFEAKLDSKESLDRGGLTILAAYASGCRALDASYVTVESADPDTVEFAYSVLYGARKAEFMKRLIEKDADRLAVTLHDTGPKGAFLLQGDRSLAFVTALDGFSYKISFLSRKPLQIAIEKWQ